MHHFLLFGRGQHAYTFESRHSDVERDNTSRAQRLKEVLNRLVKVLMGERYATESVKVNMAIVIAEDDLRACLTRIISPK
jgi:hypothetical protein